MGAASGPLDRDRRAGVLREKCPRLQVELSRTADGPDATRPVDDVLFSRGTRLELETAMDKVRQAAPPG